MRSSRVLITSLALAMVHGAVAWADTVALTAAADTSVFENNPDGNLGATTLVSGMNQKASRSRAMFLFDVNSIPPNAVIDEATVTMAVTRRPDIDQYGGPIPSTFELFRMLVDWGEGTGSGVTGTPGVVGGASWSYRRYPIDSWDYPGAGVGIDYVNQSSSQTYADLPATYVFPSTAALVADVQMWVEHPETNFGYILISQAEYTLGTARRWASKETGSAISPAPTLTVRYHLVDATVDTTFTPGPNANVRATALQGDGRVLIGGNFTQAAAQPASRIARLTSTGAADPTFAAVLDGEVQAIALQADGKAIVAGAFTQVNGTACSRLARLAPDGAYLPGLPAAPDGPIYSLAIQADGGVLVGGAFTTLGGEAHARLARIRTDDTLDPAFLPSFNGPVHCLALQNDGRILVGGDFTLANSTAQVGLVRLLANGAVDPSFVVNTDGPVFCLALQSDGRVVVGGSFATVGGEPRNGLARVDANGAVDMGFVANLTGGAQNRATSLAIECDGTIVVTGDFTALGGQSRRNVGALTPAGAVASDFSTTTDGDILASALQADGELLIGGDFANVGGAPYPYLARLKSTAATQALEAFSSNSGQGFRWTRGDSSPETQQVSFELSTDGGSTWTLLGQGSRVAGGWELHTTQLPPSGRVRARARIASGEFGGSSSLVESSLTIVGSPSVEIAPATGITPTGASLQGFVDPNNAGVTVSFELGTSTTYGTAVPLSFAGDRGDVALPVTAAVTGLLPRTTYHYRLKAETTNGTAVSADATFTTGNSVPTASSGTATAPSGAVTPISVTTLVADADGDSLTIFSAGAEHGRVTVRAGVVDYQPEVGFSGTDTLYYTVTDGFGGVASGSVAITVPTRNSTAGRDLQASTRELVPGAGVPGSDTAALPTGSRWSLFGAPATNDAGTLAFTATVATGTKTTTTGIFTGQLAAPTLVCQKGDNAPGATDARFATFKDPVLAQDGALAFMATLANAPGKRAITKANSQGIWTTAFGPLSLVARTGDPAVDGPTGAKWTRFHSVAIADGIAGPLFIASMAGGGVKPANDIGLWGTGSDGALHLLLREGDTVAAGKTIRTFVALGPVPLSPGQTRSFNQAGQIIVRASFTDGSTGVVRVTVP